MYTGGQIDINYHGNDPTSWLWVGDATGIFNTESFRFYAPAIADPVVTKTIFIGGQHVWRTTDLGGDRTFLEQHCNTAAGEFGTSDQLYTGNCGTVQRLVPARRPVADVGTAFGGRGAAATSSRSAARQGPRHDVGLDHRPAACSSRQNVEQRRPGVA